MSNAMLFKPLTPLCFVCLGTFAYAQIDKDK